MRVAFISSLNGGVGTYTIELIQALSKSIDEIDLYLFASDPVSKRLDFPKNVNIIVYTNSPLKLLILLFKHLKKLNCNDLIHLNYAAFFVPIYISKKIWGTPCILTSHGIPQPDLEKDLKKIYYLIEKYMLKVASHCSNQHVAISNYVRRHLQFEYGIESSVIYHGIQAPSQLQITNAQKQKIRKESNIPLNQFIVLYVGNMNRYKNIMTLVDAIPVALSIKKDLIFILIGKGELQGDAEQKIMNLNISDKVIFMPYAEDLTPYYLSADLFILPSVNEMFGIVLLEAMSHGLPVISSQGGACPEVLGDAGLLFNPYSKTDLAHKICQIADNNAERMMFIEKGLARVKEFTWERAAREYEDIYEEIVGGKK